MVAQIMATRSQTQFVLSKPVTMHSLVDFTPRSTCLSRLARDIACLMSLQLALEARRSHPPVGRASSSCRRANLDGEFLALDDGAGQQPLHSESGLGLGIPNDKQLRHWEHQIHALVVVLISMELVTASALHQEVAKLQGYADWGYYDKWAAALAKVLLKAGLIKLRDFDRALGGPPQDCKPFKVGDKVWIRHTVCGDPTSQWRRPYLPIPGSTSGLQGTVESRLGQRSDDSFFALRAELGLEVASMQDMYLVQFDLESVLKGNALSGADLPQKVVTVEVFESWLTCMEPEPPSPASRAPHSSVKAPKRRQLRQSLKTLAQDMHDFRARHQGSQGEHETHEPHGSHVHLPRSLVEQAAVEKEGKESPGQRVTEALLQLLTAGNIIVMSAVSRAMEVIDSVGVRPLGPRIVARAWVDPGFRQLLLEDAHAAIRTLGYEATNSTSAVTVKVVESTPMVHNLVVCTLCSCYPVTLLGLSPAWYKSREYREQAVRRPRELLKESFGLDVPEEVDLRVHDSNSELRYIVLPLRPAGTEGWAEDELASLVTRDAMIGVAMPEVAV